MSDVLYIFDFDDTLVSSGANVKVIHGDGTIELLKSHEFATYKPLPQDQFDFTEFDVYPPDGKLITNTFNILKKSISAVGPGNVMVLSARGKVGPMRDYLRDNGITSDIEIIGVGSSDPSSKADVVLKKLSAGKFTSIIIYEDSINNIDAISNAVNSQYPDIEILANKVEIKQEVLLRSTIRALIHEIIIKD
jgi:hypothetical protein